MFHKISHVKPLSDYILLIEFISGEKRQYDVRQLFGKWEAFNAFTITNGLFEQVKVDKGGYGISWNDDIDLSCDELYENGIDYIDKLNK